MNDDNYYVIEIYTDDNHPSLIDGIKSLQSNKKSSKINDESDPIVLSDVISSDKKKKKKKKSSLIFEDIDLGTDENTNTESKQEIDENTLLDIDNILMEEKLDSIEDDLTTRGKKGYKNLKKDKNNYKKEFAEELTLLYSLLDETSKFGKSLEKDFTSLKGSKVRGVSKYTNDLAELVLNAKNSKLNILKQIAALKKDIADLTMKADAKSKDDKGENNPEYLASAYFKNVLTHGRGNFIDNMTNGSKYSDDEDYGNLIDNIERSSVDDDDRYNKFLMDRLETTGNPYRSDAGSKYIEYENRGVKLYVKKCIDTGNWDFVAIDKNKQQIEDYPVPTKREAGRMKFSDDGTYATDSKGRIYNVIEYFLP